MAISPHDAFCFTPDELAILDKAEREIDKGIKTGNRWFVFDHYTRSNCWFTEAMRQEIANRYITAGWRAKVRYEQDFGQGYGGYTLSLTAPRSTLDRIKPGLTQELIDTVKKSFQEAVPE